LGTRTGSWEDIF